MGTQLPLPKKGGRAHPRHTYTIFGPGLLWSIAATINTKLGTEVGLGPGDIVLDGNPAPPPPKGHSQQFSAHVYCGQMAGSIQMSPGTEVGLGPGDIVLDGDPAPLP